MSKSERTPLTAPLNSAASTLLGGAHKVDEKAADVLTGTLTACDKFIAVILYGHIVKRRGPGICQFTIFDSILIIIHSTPWRMLMHGIMVAALILLANQVRSIDEMFLTKHVSDTFVHNHFDSSHNTFLDIRRGALARRTLPLHARGSEPREPALGRRLGRALFLPPA